MANKTKEGEQSSVAATPLGRWGRYGSDGYVQWNIDVPPEVKSWYITEAKRRDVTLKALVNEALASFISQ